MGWMMLRNKVRRVRGFNVLREEWVWYVYGEMGIREFRFVLFGMVFVFLLLGKYSLDSTYL